MRHRRAVLAISLNNPNYAHEKLAAMLRLMRRHFDETILLVGDSVYRLTLDLDGLLGEPRALDAAIACGNAFIRDREDLLESDAAHRLRFLRCSELWNEPEVGIALNELEHLYRTHEGFRCSVESFSSGYLKRVGTTSASAAIAARRYLLEELALFSFLARHDCGLILYAGHIQTLSDIVHGSCGDLAHLFPDLAMASVRVE